MQTLKCIYCHAVVAASNGDVRYRDHLFKEHNILFDIDHVVERTLRSVPKETSEAGVQVDLLPINTSTSPRVKRERNASTDSSSACKRVKMSPQSTPSPPPPPATKKVAVPWYGGTEYQCRICREMYFYIESLRKHVKRTHGDVDTYIDEHGQFETKAAMYTCELCSETIKRNISSIRGHLGVKHDGMTIEDYERRFKLSYYYEVEVPADVNVPAIPTLNKSPMGDQAASKVKSEEAPKKAENITSRRKSLKQEPEVQDEGSSDLPDIEERPRSPLPPYKEWTTGDCTFKCAVCPDFSAMCSITFWKHAKLEHSFTPSEYKSRHGQPCTNKTKFQCPLCPKVMRHEYGSLNAHAVYGHNINLKSFYKKCVGKISGRDSDKTKSDVTPSTEGSFKKWRDGSLAKCAICQWKGTSTAFSHHVTYNHKTTVKNYRQEHGDEVYKKLLHKCLICKAEVQRSYMTLYMHFNNVHKLKIKEYYEKYILGASENNRTVVVNLKKKPECPWFNMCEFNCRICPKKFTTRNDLRCHIRKAHKIMKAIQYVMAHGKMMSKKVMHKCKICGSVITCTKIDIVRHLENHGTTLERYTKQFVEAESVDLDKDNEDQTGGGKNVQSANKWSSQCEYQCLECQRIFTTTQELGIHIKNVHSIDLNSYRKKHGVDKMMTKEVKFTCHLCGAVIQWVRNSLEVHASRKHGISLHQMHQSWLAQRKGNADNGQDAGYDNDEDKSPELTEDEGDSKQHLQPASESISNEGKTGSENEYFTPELSAEDETSDDQEESDSEGVDQNSNDKKPSVKKEPHCDGNDSSSQILPSGLSPEPTEDDTGCNGEGSKDKTPQPTEDDNTSEESEPNGNDDKPTIKKEPQDGRGLRSTNVKVEAGFGNERDWMSRRRKAIICKDCSKSVSEASFASHLRKEHDSDQGLYRLFYGEPVLVWIDDYECELCSAEVSHNEESITRHLRSEHNLSPEEYWAKFR